LSRLAPLIREQTVILPLLNGVDISARVRHIITNGILLPACVYVGTHIERPGVIAQKGGACKILFGPDPLYPQFSPNEILKLFAVPISNANGPLTSRWRFGKSLSSSAPSALSPLRSTKPWARSSTVTASGPMHRPLSTKPLNWRRFSGVRLPPDTAEATLLKARSFPHETRTSFQRDFERSDRKDERDLFAGAMLRVASQFRVLIPATQRVAAVLEKRKPAARAAA
jgi:2-dehydropantoate 2-reductase